MKKKRTSQSAFVNLRAAFVLLLCAAACCTVAGTPMAFFRSEAPTKLSQQTLTFADRVTYQRAIEEVYWRHRIWPKGRPDPKPWLDAVISQAQIEEKVQDYLRNSQALENYWQRPITPEELQAEMDRMAQHTKNPEMLRELFDALGNDPFVIAECLARPAIVEQLVTNFYAHDSYPLAARPVRAENQMPKLIAAASRSYTLPTVSSGAACSDDTWTATSTTNAPSARPGQTAVWTGSEMIAWGGLAVTGFPTNTGGRFNPATNSWTATTLTNAPSARQIHTAVWTGRENVVWGGIEESLQYPNVGGRYNPDADSWIATSTINAPSGRISHTAVWTGSEMIVWGGDNPSQLNTGGRYCAQSEATPTPSPTATPTPAPRATPLPRPRPSPAPRP